MLLECQSISIGCRCWSENKSGQLLRDKPGEGGQDKGFLTASFPSLPVCKVPFSQAEEHHSTGKHDPGQGRLPSERDAVVAVKVFCQGWAGWWDQLHRSITLYQSFFHLLAAAYPCSVAKRGWEEFYYVCRWWWLGCCQSLGLISHNSHMLPSSCSHPTFPPPFRHAPLLPNVLVGWIFNSLKPLWIKLSEV